MLMPRRSEGRGFSLVELMVTIGLLSVLLMAVIPDMSSWLRGIQVRNQAEAIQTGLQRARNEAVRRNREVQFSLVSLADPSKMDNTCALATNAASWAISLQSPAGKCGAAFSDLDEPRLIATNAAGAGMTKVKVVSTGDGSAPANSVTFDHYGRMKGNREPIQRIDIEALPADPDARRLRIVLTAAGSIRMCDVAVSAATDPRKC